MGKCVAFGVILAGDFYLLFFVCVYVCNIAEVRFGFNCQVKKQIQEAGFLCDHDLDSGTTMNKKIRNAQLAQYNFIFGQWKKKLRAFVGWMNLSTWIPVCLLSEYNADYFLLTSLIHCFCCYTFFGKRDECEVHVFTSDILFQLKMYAKCLYPTDPVYCDHYSSQGHNSG